MIKPPVGRAPAPVFKNKGERDEFPTISSEDEKVMLTVSRDQADLYHYPVGQPLGPSVDMRENCQRGEVEWSTKQSMIPQTGLCQLCVHMPCLTAFLWLVTWCHREDFLHVNKGCCIWNWSQSWEANVLHTCHLTIVVKINFLIGTRDHYCCSHWHTLCPAT